MPLQYPYHPDEDRDSVELIESRGFTCETHNVTTRDGYILTVFRIVNPYINCDALKKPVLFQHGLFGSSDDYLMNSFGALNEKGDYVEELKLRHVGKRMLNGNEKVVGNTIAFVLAHFGYDVWLANFRGNHYSERHVQLTNKDKTFWEYTQDELILIDLPTCINYVLQRTGKPHIAYIGMSLGAQMIFGLLASEPAFGDYVKPIIAICPVVNLSLGKSIQFKFMPLLPQTFLESLRGNAAPRKKISSCRAALLRNKIFGCMTVFFYMIAWGFDFKQVNSVSVM